MSRRGKPLSFEQVELVTHTAPYAWAYITSTEADRKVGGGEGWGGGGGGLSWKHHFEDNNGKQ